MTKNYLNIKQTLTIPACKKQTEIALTKLEEIKGLEIDSDWEEGKELLAAKHKTYNVFSYPEFIFLKRHIVNRIPSKFKNKGYGIKGWINYLEPFESLQEHTHHYDLSGHITLRARSGNTFYVIDGAEFEIEAKVGNLHLLSRGIPHRVGENLSTTPRISIAFDVIRYDEIEEDLHPLLERI